MHPNVYKKQHKPLRAVFRFLILIMILCPVDPVSSQSCNYAVKKVQIHAHASKGVLRIESSHGNRVVAKKCKEDCTSDLYYVYTVTIDKHHMLLYHYKSSMFICWNRGFTKLVGRVNPTNLTYCKFEEKPSRLQSGSHVRYTTPYSRDEEAEIAFLRSGLFANKSRRLKCHQRRKKICYSPDFLPLLGNTCDSYLSQFCTQMKSLRDKGHTISPELMDLCKNVWSKKN